MGLACQGRVAHALVCRVQLLATAIDAKLIGTDTANLQSFGQVQVRTSWAAQLIVDHLVNSWVLAAEKDDPLFCC